MPATNGRLTSKFCPRKPPSPIAVGCAVATVRGVATNRQLDGRPAPGCRETLRSEVLHASLQIIPLIPRAIRAWQEICLLEIPRLACSGPGCCCLDCSRGGGSARAECVPQVCFVDTPAPGSFWPMFAGPIGVVIRRCQGPGKRLPAEEPRPLVAGMQDGTFATVRTGFVRGVRGFNRAMSAGADSARAPASGSFTFPPFFWSP